ncbi:AAA family ATPase [uncultured Cohaesibacter sp.]|uniref:AAA family ATPase n=1 Tax=uncultured Cohaesibacter sp. TaxID=1002546 RepID=UPI00292D79B4|nr:AAA family ATPase [uncultured Cohaesibacter sp.]
MMQHVILSGCSGGGKSTLLNELACRGFETVPEPGRRIIDLEREGDGSALPWVNMEAFARRALEMAARDKLQVKHESEWQFFDRSLIDAAVALESATGEAVENTLAPFPRYYAKVFMTPPWFEIYSMDIDRVHGFEEALGEFDRLVAAYNRLSYKVIHLPKTDVQSRADFVLRLLR